LSPAIARHLRLEDAALFALALILYADLGYPAWVFVALFLVPDVSMLAYAAGPAVGARVYNAAHNRSIAVVVYAVGLALQEPIASLAGVILLGHSSLDRALGFGLKLPDSFHHTHLGAIGSRDRYS
jgi:hypothetical protein